MRARWRNNLCMVSRPPTCCFQKKRETANILFPPQDLHPKRPLDLPPPRWYPLWRWKLRRLHLRFKIPRPLLWHLRRLCTRWKRRPALRNWRYVTPCRTQNVCQPRPALERDDACVD